jgi:hypothetical protein
MYSRGERCATRELVAATKQPHLDPGERCALIEVVTGDATNERTGEPYRRLLSQTILSWA